MSRIGGMDRAICPSCGEDTAVRVDGTMTAHGPESARCRGGRPPATPPVMAELPGDRAAGRSLLDVTPDDRLIGAAMNANDVAWRWGRRTPLPYWTGRADAAEREARRNGL